MDSASPLLLLFLLVAFAARSEARPAIVTQGNLPVFTAAAAGAHTALSDALVLDLSQESAEGVTNRLAAERPEVIITVGPSALQLAVRSSRTTPIVFVMVAEPQAIAGSVEDRPLIGVGLHVPPQAMLSELRKLDPQARDLWTVYSRAESGPTVERLRAEATAQGLSLTANEAGSSADALRQLLAPPGHVDACLMLGDRVVRNAAADQALLRVAFAHHFPVVGVSADDVRAGALFALQLDARAMGAQAGELARQASARGGAHKIEIVPPTGYRLVVNVATAQHLGLAVPPEILSHAEILGK